MEVAVHLHAPCWMNPGDFGDAMAARQVLGLHLSIIFLVILFFTNYSILSLKLSDLNVNFSEKDRKTDNIYSAVKV